MQSKTKDNVTKIRITQEDMPKIASALVIPILSAFVADNLDGMNSAKVVPVQAYALELRGDIILTITSDPEALLAECIPAECIPAECIPHAV